MRCIAARHLWLMVLLATALPLFAGKGPIWIKSAAQIANSWKEDQHLYIIGRTGVPDEGLRDLELWLDGNAPGWTVLLIQKSERQRFTGATGERYTGIDAVEQAMSQKLRNLPGFANQMDPRSNRASGAFLVMLLEDRKFLYFGDDHYAENGAGPNSWKDDLDEKARTAMRDGGRIVDAVRDTVTSIEARITKSLERKQQERKQTENELGSEINTLSELLEKAAQERASVIAESGEAQNLLNDFPKDDYESRLNEMKASVSEEDYGRAHLAGTILRQELEGSLDEIESFKAAYKSLSQLRELVGSASAKTEAGRTQLELARHNLALAESSFASGNQNFRNEMQASRVALQLAPMKDREILKTEERKQRTYKIGGATGAGAIGLLCVLGNRGRRRAKKEAENLLARRKAEMKETGERLFKIMDRSEIIVGDHEELENRGYQGETLERSKIALATIDGAFVLSSHAQKIIERAETLIGPRNPISGVRNLVSRGRYHKAIDLLDSELNVGLKNVPKLKDRERPGEKVDETFSVPIDEWKARTASALDEAEAALDEVEKAWSTIVGRKESLRKQLKRLQKREKKIQVDQWLRCEELFGEWEDAMNDCYEEAVALSEADPVKSLNGDLGKGDRMVAEAHHLLDIITKVRENKWESLEKNETILDERGRATLWIDRGLEKLGEQCDLIAQKSPEREVSEEIDLFKTACAEFMDRVSLGCDLAARAEDQSLIEIDTAAKEVTDARKLFAEKLSLTPDQMLSEKERNPDSYLAEARRQHEGALAALDLGNVKAAEKFLDETDRLISRSREVIKQSGEVLEDFPEANEELISEYDSLVSGGRIMNTSIIGMTRRFSPDALLIDPEDPKSGSYRDLPAQLEKDLDEILIATNRSKTRYEAGGLLESWELIERGRFLAKQGENLCIRTVAREQKMAKLESENERNLRAQILEEQDLQTPLNDRRITVKTLSVFSAISVGLREAESELNAPDGRRNPYRVQKLLGETGAKLPVLRESMAADIEEHLQAIQLFETVERNYAESRQLLQTATNDRIPNSPETNRSIDEIEKCFGWLSEAREELETDHADWQEIQASLREIHLTLSEVSLTLERELRLANQVVNALQASTHEVDRAARWSGFHGVRISGSYGRRALATANDDLQHGRYDSALAGARTARSKARSAIASAEAEEASRRRSARLSRQRSRASRSSFGISGSSTSIRSSSIGGSFSTTRISGGVSSSGSGANVGRSSFRSGSGVGKSGW